MPGRLRPMLAMSLVACAPHADWAEVREACHLSEVPDDLHAALDADDPIGGEMSISEACASALARSHGATLSALNVDEFPLTDAEEMGEIVVSGLFDLAAADFGTTDDLLAIDGLADDVVDALTALDEPDAATALFQYSAGAIRTIALTDEDAAGIWSSGGHVTVPTEFSEVTPIRMAAIFTHEASHRSDVPGHVECFETRTGYPFCDLNSEGAHGLEAAVKYSWLLALAADPAIDHAACHSMCEDMNLWDTCTSILDETGFVPCIDADSACWDHCPL